MNLPDNVTPLAAALQRSQLYTLRSNAPAEGFRDYLEDLCNGAELTRVRQIGVGVEGERWQLVLRIGDEHRTLELTEEDLNTPKLFKSKVWRVTDVTPRLRRSELDDVKDAVKETVRSDLEEEVDGGWSECRETLDWLRGFVGDEGIGLGDRDDPADLHDVLGGGSRSFRDRNDGRLYIRPNELARYVTRDESQRATSKSIAGRLGALGFESEQLSARRPGAGRGGKVRKARYWVSPPDFDLDD